MAQRTLYAFHWSANSHRARLMLHLLGLQFDEVEVDLVTGEHRQAAFLAINPVGQVPALRDGDTLLHDSHAIAQYLCDRYDARADDAQRWLPREAAARARIQQWLFFDANELHNSLGYARNAVSFGVPTDLAAAQGRARAALGVLEQRLARTPDDAAWLEGNTPTLADLACYPLVSLAPEAGMPLQPWPRVQNWVQRIEALPGVQPTPRLR